jgi:hypothetical protein
VSWCNGPDTGEGKEGRNPTKVNFFLLKKKEKRENKFLGFLVLSRFRYISKEFLTCGRKY